MLLRSLTLGTAALLLTFPGQPVWAEGLIAQAETAPSAAEESPADALSIDDAPEDGGEQPENTEQPP